MKFRKFSYLYFVLLFGHLAILFKEPESFLVSVTKPTLLISLIGFYLQDGFRKLLYFEKLFVAGLFFSLIGDVLLLNVNWFIGGLSAFLLAQLSYSFSFFRSNLNKAGLVQRAPLVVLPVLLYSAGFVLGIYSDLGEMFPPVIVYTAVITLMLLAAINRQGTTNRDSFQFVLLGAVLFVISDTILAVNKFKFVLDWAPIAIMLTYGLAQYFLVWGMKSIRRSLPATE